MRCDRELEAVAWILAVLEARTAAAPQISMGAINDNGFDKSLDGTCFTSVKLIKQLIRPRQRRGHSLQLFYFPLVIFLPCPSSFSFRKHRSRCSHLFFFFFSSSRFLYFIKYLVFVSKYQRENPCWRENELDLLCRIFINIIVAM